MNKAEAIANRIKSNDNFENVAYVCCDWEEFVFEVAEWGVDHIATVDFDDLTPDDISFLDEFIASLVALHLNRTHAQSTQTPVCVMSIHTFLSYSHYSPFYYYV